MRPPRPPDSVPLVVAASQLGVHPSTVRRWIADEGAPCVELGSVGRGKGSLVDIEELRRWLAERHGAKHNGAGTFPTDLLDRLAEALWDTLRRDEAHLRVGGIERDTASVLLMAYGRLWQNLTHRPLDELVNLPPKIAQLRAICLE